MCDHQDCAVALRLQSSVYKLSLYNIFLIDHPYFVFCFRQRDVKVVDNNNCEVDGLGNGYTCLSVVPIVSAGTITSVTMNTWTSDSNINTFSAKSSYPSSNADLTSSNRQTQITITSLMLFDNKTYELYAGYQDRLQADSQTKNAFFSTFKLTSQTDNSNLMMQRNVACFLFFYYEYYNFNLLFYGGVIRKTN